MQENTDFPSVEFAPHSPDIDLARRLAFILSMAERSLGLAQQQLPLDARLEAVLDAAMLAPEAITPIKFRIIYSLMNSMRANSADQSIAG